MKIVIVLFFRMRKMMRFDRMKWDESRKIENDENWISFDKYVISLLLYVKSIKNYLRITS